MELLDMVGLTKFRDDEAQKMSFGQQKLLEFAAILMSDPELILLDEPAGGVNRAMAAFLLAAYDEDIVNDEPRTVLRLHPRLAPYKVAVLPLSKKDTLTPLARTVYATLADRYMVDYDETQAIGKRYRRQDEIGTPLCVTIDFESLEDAAVTIRDRDTTAQQRVPIAQLTAEITARLGF